MFACTFQVQSHPCTARLCIIPKRLSFEFILYAARRETIAEIPTAMKTSPV